MSLIRTFLERAGFIKPENFSGNFETPARTSTQREYEILARKMAANKGLTGGFDLSTGETLNPRSTKFSDDILPVVILASAAATASLAETPVPVSAAPPITNTDFGVAGFSGGDASAVFAPSTM